jgi:hypothetical protein
MKTAIRYYSKFGHTTKMANIVGELTNTRPELATVRLSEPVDTLYLGSGVFLGKQAGLRVFPHRNDVR